MIFICTAVTCPSLGLLSEGVISYNSDTTAPHDFMTTATYTCNTTDYGLSTSGDRVRTCVGSSAGPGEWSGTAPICEGTYEHNVNHTIRALLPSY